MMLSRMTEERNKKCLKKLEQMMTELKFWGDQFFKNMF